MSDNAVSKDSRSQTSSYEAILKEASKKPASKISFAKTFPAYIVLIIMLAISATVFHFIKKDIEESAYLAFDKSCGSVMNRFERKYRSDLGVLESLKGLYDAKAAKNSYVVRDVFELHASFPTKSYASILSMIHARYVPLDQKEDFFYFSTAEYWEYPFEIPPERPFYYFVEYISPMDSSYNSFFPIGFDFATVLVVKEAIEKARDSNMVAATPSLTLRPDTSGFFLIIPNYKRDSSITTVYQKRKNFDGALMLVLDTKKFFESALGSKTASDTSIVFQCYEETVSGGENVVYSSDNADLLKTSYEPYKIETRELKIADKTVHVRFSTIPEFGGKIQKYVPYIALAGSAILSFVFFGFMISVITGRARAVDLAERMTRSQRRIVESSQDVIAALDLDGRWKSLNPAFEEIFGYPAEDFAGKKIYSLFSKESDAEDFRNKVAAVEDETTERIDYRMFADGEKIKWISWNFTISKQDKLIYAIGRDVTLEKLAEEEARFRAKQIRLAEQLAREASEFKSFFMTKLSHQLRNSLTGILGYLQLLSEKIYETDEERDSYVELAEQSSEELFQFVSDIVDVAVGSEDSEEKMELSNLVVKEIVDKAIAYCKENGVEINCDMPEEFAASRAIADDKRLTRTIAELFIAFSGDSERNNFLVQAQENAYEGATEIQILGPGNEVAEEMIEAYKYNKSSLIEALRLDKDDILLRLAIAASNFRLMSGSMSVESLGGVEGNLAMITLPLNKKEQS